MAEPGIVILGAGGHARVVAEAAGLCGLRLIGHLAPEDEGNGPGDWLGGDGRIAELAQAGHRFIPGIGFVDARGAARRARILAALPAAALCSVTHPAAVVSASARIGGGSFIGPGAIIGVGAQIGGFALINSGAIVDHDCQIGANCHISAASALSGDVRLGDNVLIGAGAVVRQGIRIGANVVIGAGAVVVSDIAAGSVAFGNPARIRGDA